MQWCSWAWEVQNLDDHASGVSLALRLFASDKTDPLHNIAAEEGWWNLDRSELDPWAEHVGIVISGATNLLPDLVGNDLPGERHR